MGKTIIVHGTIPITDTLLAQAVDPNSVVREAEDRLRDEMLSRVYVGKRGGLYVVDPKTFWWSAIRSSFIKQVTEYEGAMVAHYKRRAVAK